jgi:beta-mannosidase
MELKSYSLSTGWSFRDQATEDWMPVSTVPSVVQQDLLDNDK